MNFVKKNIKSGFTLIELLVVISIIGILAAMATLSFTGAQKQARDTTRKSDLAQYRTALEMYANKNNGLYPIFGSKVDPSVSLCTPLGLTCPGPEDPKNSTDNTYYYQYQSDTAGTEYVLWTAKMENLTGKWAVCSNGKSGLAPSSSLPPIVGSGACPI